MTEITPEQVLTVEASSVREAFGGRQWLPRGAGLAASLEPFVAPCFVARDVQLESDPSLKQIIPYVVLRCGDSIYRYTRGMAGGEGRLHQRTSIGIGGHINPCDAEHDRATANIVRRAAYREFKEEVGSAGERLVKSNQFVGMINDDGDPVGRVHLGICMVFDLYSTDIEPREAAIRDGRWVHARDLWITPNLETWSEIVVKNLFAAEGVVL